MRRHLLLFAAVLACSIAKADQNFKINPDQKLTPVAKSVRNDGTIWLGSEKCLVPGMQGNAAVFLTPHGAKLGCWEVSSGFIKLTWFDLTEPDSKGLRGTTNTLSSVERLDGYEKEPGTDWPPADGKRKPPTLVQSIVDREVKGWGADPGWQWKDNALRKYDNAWRAINLGAPIDCSPMSLEGARILERGFVGQVVHVYEDGLPAVYMLRDSIQITFMPIDLEGCKRKAKEISSASN